MRIIIEIAIAALLIALLYRRGNRMGYEAGYIRGTQDERNAVPLDTYHQGLADKNAELLGLDPDACALWKEHKGPHAR